MQNWSEFNEFMQRVQEAKDQLKLRPHQECFYRGHRDRSYKLQPSLFRQKVGSVAEDLSFEEHWKLERRMFFDFRTRARQLYSTENDDWDILFHMQHHGVPTRLLDWTSVFGVALYFALLDHDEQAERPLHLASEPLRPES